MVLERSHTKPRRIYEPFLMINHDIDSPSVTNKITNPSD